MKSYLVIGMGNFGKSIANTLYENNMEVLAIDINEEIIQDEINSNRIYNAIAMDAKDETTLKNVVKDSFDTAFVCVGGNTQDSILITLILKEMGIKRIICKAINKLHGKVLEKVGATRIIYPEEEMGVKIAFSEIHPTIYEYFKFTDDYAVIEVEVPEVFIGKSLQELNLRNRYGANIMAIKSVDGKFNASPHYNTVLEKEQKLVIFGQTSKIQELVEL